MTRRRFTAWAFAATLAVSAFASSALGQTYVNAVSAWGAVGDGSTDNYATLQPRFDALAPNTRVHFPAGKYMTSRPLHHGQSNVWVSGDGSASIISLYPNTYYYPPLIVGIRTVEGSIPTSVANANRPDLFGVLDAGYVTGANGWFGFRTNGNTVCQAFQGPGSIGALSANSTANGGRVFDYWGEATGICVRACVFVTSGSVAAMRADGNGSNIIGLGSTTDPGPWKLGVDSSSPCNLFFSFRTADQGIDSSSPYSYFRVPFPTSGGRAVTGGTIHDVEAYVNFLDGTYGMRINNVAGTVVNSANVTGLTGKRLAKNRGYKFTLGPNRNPTLMNFSSGPVPDFGVYAFNVLRTATLASANTDTARYAATANTVISTDATSTSALRTDRTVLLKSGSCVPFSGTAMWIYSTLDPGRTIGDPLRNVDLGFVKDCKVSDLFFVGGLGLGTFNHIDIDNVICDNGIQGHEHLGLGTAYTASVRGGQISGYDAAFDYSEAVVDFTGTRVQGLGDVAGRMRACTVNVNAMMVAGFPTSGDSSRAVFDMIAGDTNGLYSFRGVNIDSEGDSFLDPNGDGGAVFKIDMHPSSPNTVLNLQAVQLDSANGGAAFVLARGAKGTSTGGNINVSGCQTGAAVGNLIKFTGPDWKAAVDRQGLKVQTVVGNAASVAAVTFVGEAVPAGARPRVGR